jgi:acyl-CoA-dependent ceramide synthase
VYFRLLWSTERDTRFLIRDGCYSKGSTTVEIWGGSNSLMDYLRPFWDADAKRCWTGVTRNGFLILLGSLQVLTICWFIMIARIAWKVITGKGAEDTRSDDELDEEEAEAAEVELERLQNTDTLLTAASQPLAATNLAFDEAPLKTQYVEEEAGIEEMETSLRSRSTVRSNSSNSNGRTRRRPIDVQGSSSAVKKELLGRIGCDKG